MRVKNALKLGIFSIVFFICGIFFGKYFLFENNQCNCEEIGDFKAGWDAAKQRLYSNHESEFNLNHDVQRKSATGEIINIKNNILEVKIRPMELLAYLELDYRQVVIDDNTKLLMQQKKSQDEYSTELDNFFSDNPKYKGLADAPTPNLYKEESINIKDLNVGQMLEIESIKDITNEKKFVASKIIVIKN